MNYANINEIDLKLLLLGGDTIEVENLAITPYKLKEIKKYGYTNYMKNLQWVSVSVDDFISSIQDIEKRIHLESEKSKLKAYDFYIKLGGEDLLLTLINTLKMIFKTDDVRVLDESVIAIDFVKKGIMIVGEDGSIDIDSDKLDTLSEDEIMLVHRENFDQIIEVVKLQNYLERPSSVKSENAFADEETRKLMEHMEKMRKKVEAKKKAQKADEGEADIDIADIISAVSTKSHSINKLNVWELTLYQLYDEYARLELIDNYDFSIKAMMAGAKDVDLKHWSSKL
jgi:hypothetical protein